MISRRAFAGSAVCALLGSCTNASSDMIKLDEPRAPFRPTRVIHVAPNGDDAHSGEADAPLRTIQAGLDRSAPGVLVAVHAGEYAESAHFPSRRGGADQAPIVLESVDGLGAARVRPVGDDNGIRGYGVFNIVVRGFDIEGGKNGIQFSQSGDDFSALCRNIWVEDNAIRSPRQDGIKISQTDNVFVTGNRIEKCGQQCVDYFNVYGGRISDNEASDAHVAAAIMVKGASRDVVIENNWVHDVEGLSVAGIAIGGYSGAQYIRPLATDAEALNVEARGNCVERVEGFALVFFGAWRSRAHNNYLSSVQVRGRRTARGIIGVERGSPFTRPVDNQRLEVTGNVLGIDKPEAAIDMRYQNVERDHITIERNAIGGDWLGLSRWNSACRAGS